MPPSTLPSPITTMKLRFSTGTSPNVLTYEQTIPSAAQGANSVQVTNSSLLAAFSSEPLGTIFTPSMVTTYSGFPSGNTISTPSIVENFIPGVISLESIPTKLTTDAPFSLSSLITTVSTGVLSYTSSNTGVATVHASTGLVTIIGEGTTTITVTQGADATYITASKSTTLTVTPPYLFLINNPSIPTISLTNFPTLGTMSNWEMDIKFKKTGGDNTLLPGDNTWLPLIGDMYNAINSRGWGVWITPLNNLHFSWNSVSSAWYAYPAINVLSDTDYILKITRTPSSLTLVLTDVDENISQTAINTEMSDTSAYVMSSDGPVAVGGWNSAYNAFNEYFIGTISYVRVT